MIDIVCFRKLGHNEQDEPAVTQPLMYKKIAQHPGTRKLYADKLIAQKVIDEAEPEELIKTYRETLDGRPAVGQPGAVELQVASSPSTGRRSSARSGPTPRTPTCRWKN